MEQSIMNNMNVDSDRIYNNRSNNQTNLNQNSYNNCELPNSLSKQFTQTSDKNNNKSLYDPFTGAVLKGGNTKKHPNNFGNDIHEIQRLTNCNFNNPADMKYSKFFKPNRT